MVILPPKGGATYELRVKSWALDTFLSFYELDDIGDVRWEKGAFKDGLTLSLADGCQVKLVARRYVVKEFLEAFEAAQASRVPLLQFVDADEKVLFKTSLGRSKEHYGVPIGYEWKNLFEFGDEDLWATAKLCITNRRILFYRFNSILKVSHYPPNVEVTYGPARLQFVQIPLEGVVRVYWKRRLFWKYVGLCLRGFQPTGHDVFGAVPPVGAEVGTSDESNRQEVASGGDLETNFLSTDFRWVRQVVDALREVIPTAVEVPVE